MTTTTRNAAGTPGTRPAPAPIPPIAAGARPLHHCACGHGQREHYADSMECQACGYEGCPRFHVQPWMA